MKKKILLVMLLFLIIICMLVINKNTGSEQKVLDDRPSDNEPYKKKKTIKSEVTDEKKEIELKYDQYVVANGFIGASDNAYFTRNNVLYHLVISTDTVTKLAVGIKKIENDKDSLNAYKDKDFKIINEDEYVTYVD